MCNSIHPFRELNEVNVVEIAYFLKVYANDIYHLSFFSHKIQSLLESQAIIAHANRINHGYTAYLDVDWTSISQSLVYQKRHK
jgi:hypothetical protein